MFNAADFGLLEEQSSQKCAIPCLGQRETAEKNLMPLATGTVIIGCP